MMDYYVVSTSDGEFGGICEVMGEGGIPLDQLSDVANSNLMTYWDETFRGFGDLVSVGGGGRPMAVSRRVVAAIAGLELPPGTILKGLSVHEDVGRPIMEELTAIIFRESPLLLSDHDREIFLSGGLDRLDSGVLDRISLESRVIPSADLFVGSAPLCCCSDRFRDVVEANGLSNFHFSRIRIR